jgi:hypothetical protein
MKGVVRHKDYICFVKVVGWDMNPNARIDVGTFDFKVRKKAGSPALVG